MTYDVVAPIFLAPLPEPVAAPLLPDTPARRLRDAVEPIATQGWWSPASGAAVADLALSFLPSYVWGRAAALGDCVPEVAASAFAVFEPSVIAGACAAGRAAASAADILTARERGGSGSIDAVVSADDADAISAPLLAATAGLDALGRPLFAALRAQPLPASPGGRLWRAAELVREHRGDGHVAALVTAGLDAVEANVLTELWLGYGLGQYSATRGFTRERIDAAVEQLGARGWLRDGGLTEAGRAARLAIEDATDRSQDALVASLGPELDDVVARCQRVGDLLLGRGWVPADPRKRAGG